MYNYNNNYLWSYIFFNYLSKLGVKYAVVSPGSRNTPINCALEDISNIEKTVILDERQAGYFALGLAKSTNSPVLISTTSGTAVANLYPAIIEAYKSRIPLIICSADRSYEELFTESNQTINQNNLFANHINWFYQFPLPDLSSVGINTLKQIAENTLLQCFYKRKGPVHLNLPFRKPLEPSSYNIFFDSNLLNELLNILKLEESVNKDNFKNIMKKVQTNTGLKGKDLFMPVRVALTGKTHGPELPLIVDVFGKEECIRRILSVKNN